MNRHIHDLTNRRLLIAGMFLVVWSTSVVDAGPDHYEPAPLSPPGGPSVPTEAGSVTSTAQPVYKPPPCLTPYTLDLQAIHGKLTKTSTAGVDDLQDMYIIRITDPVNFMMSTSPAVCVGDEGTTPCGMADFDTQLWLFRIDGMTTKGLLANDDVGAPSLCGNGTLNPGEQCDDGNVMNDLVCCSSCELPNSMGACAVGTSSLLVSPATDGSGANIPAFGAGTYLLAITAHNNDPISATGGIFSQVTSSEVSGPDGAGGAGDHTGWMGADSLGVGDHPYVIVLRGAQAFSTEEFCPEIPTVSTTGLIVLAVALSLGMALIWRRHPQLEKTTMPV